MKRTWGETWRKVVELGAEKEVAYAKQKEAFIRAANQWQNYIAQAARPCIEKYVISQHNIPNLLGDPDHNMDVVHYSGMELVYSASAAKAYYFECDGNGTCTITHGGNADVVQMTRAAGYTVYKGFAEGNVTMTFSGAHSYNIRNIAIYGETVSPDENDIPQYRAYVPYDLKELTKSNGVEVFMDFSGDDPIYAGDYSADDSYEPLDEYYKQDRSVILLPNNKNGEFTVWYKRYPTPITSAVTDDTEIDLDMAAADILPYYMAYTLWMDDSPTIAVYWQNTADDLMAGLIRSDTLKTSTCSYENTSDWWR